MHDDATDACVHSIETCGTVDGPGVRYVLFLSGCPLRCQYCHNPDTQGKPSGDRRDAASVVADIVRYRNFIKSGGLTISGGEPLMQADFVHAVFERVKHAGLHTTLDTSGFLGDRASDELLACTDLVLLDIKSFAPDTYKIVTGVELQPTLRFAKRLDALGKPMWIRFVLVPGLTDAHENVDGLARFVAGLSSVQRVEVLPFHKMGESKYEQSGMDYQLAGTPEPTAAEMQAVRDIFESHDVSAG